MKKAGGSKADLKAVAQKKDQAAVLKDANTDVVVVGAGGSGMAAAIEAKRKGRYPDRKASDDRRHHSFVFHSI